MSYRKLFHMVFWLSFILTGAFTIRYFELLLQINTFDSQIIMQKIYMQDLERVYSKLYENNKISSDEKGELFTYLTEIYKRCPLCRIGVNDLDEIVITVYSEYHFDTRYRDACTYIKDGDFILDKNRSKELSTGFKKFIFKHNIIFTHEKSGQSKACY